MAILTAEQKRIVAKRWIESAYKDLPKTADLNSTDIIAAVQDAEDWAQSNKASFNTALPQPFKGTATSKEKSFLLIYIIMRDQGLI